MKVQGSQHIEQMFSLLHVILKQDMVLGVSIDGSKVTQCNSKMISMSKFLKYYYADSSTDHIIEHNQKWALGCASKPIFQFAYLMLPTKCNQKCQGCFMGKDKGKLPAHLSGTYFSPRELSEILLFLREHKTKALVYGGGGELFTWKNAFKLIETVTNSGMKMVVFTNGTLLSKSDIARLNSMEVALIVSLRDTVESYHNSMVGSNNFLKTLSTIDYALAERFQHNGRLAVEIPVTKENEERIIENFLPAMRSLGIVPMIEEYIQISTSNQEKTSCHNFNQSRLFFEKLSQKDSDFNIPWTPEFGQRMIAQPQCKRPLYSFAIFPNGDVMDCPSHSVCYGNLKNSTLREVIYSHSFKKAILEFNLCACSVFYTSSHKQIPEYLPNYLEVLR